MKKNEIDCNVIADLLPLYKEDICSEESRTLVEEHLSTCGDCRLLCENLTIPAPQKISEPDEAETFRKVNRKLRNSRFTKIMSVFASICLVIFGIWNIAWYFMDYLPYDKLGRNMQYLDTHHGYEYISSDQIYTYNIYMPRYLQPQSGFISILPNSRLSADSPYVIMYIWLINGKKEYGAEIIDGSAGYQIYIDEFLNLIPFDNQSDEEKELYEKILAENHDKIEALMKAAQEKWGDNL